jgi:biopolymer transport protein ExbD
MSDLVFLLLIFFMLTSTLISPNAIKLLLPKSNSKTMAKQTLTIYINDELQYFVEENPVAEQSLENIVFQKISNMDNATIVLRADKTVPVQYIVNIIDVVNNINKSTKTKHKVILATSPRK